MSSDVAAAESESSGAADQPAALRCLKDIRPLYFLPQDPLAEEILIPGFQAAAKVDCMVGFFSSEVLASLAPGLATYISRSQDSFRLIISPLLRPEDLARISHQSRCIGPRNLRKSSCGKGLPDSEAGSDANTVYL